MIAEARPSWDKTWIAVAKTIAQRSKCSRDKVGAVVVSKANRLLETGYNGPPSGFTADGQCSSWCERARGKNFAWSADPDYTGPPYEFESGPSGTWYVRRGTFVRPITEDTDLTPYGFKKEMLPPERDYTDCPSLHAEANALLRGDRQAREGGTIYVTSHVCMGCAKLIANSGLASVYVDSSITDPVWRQPKSVYEFLDKCGIDVYAA